MITIINYGLGNISAFLNAFKRIGLPVKVAEDHLDLENASKIILPGVGAFDNAVDKLNNSGMKKILDKKVLEEKTPILGICIGMHLMAKSSQEGNKVGLGWFDGEVKKIEKKLIPFKPILPHMGWNRIEKKIDHPILYGLNNEEFYFLHSYVFNFSYENNHTIATTKYGEIFPSIIINKNICGIQFHPEKSHSSGEKILKNFAEHF